MLSGAAPSGRAPIEIEPLPETSWPLLLKLKVGPAPEAIEVPLGVVSCQFVCH